MSVWIFLCFFFFNDTATTEIYTLSLHDALPISRRTSDVLLDRHADEAAVLDPGAVVVLDVLLAQDLAQHEPRRSEEHTSELQSRQYLVCRLLLEKKKKTSN